MCSQERYMTFKYFRWIHPPPQSWRRFRRTNLRPPQWRTILRRSLASPCLYAQRCCTWSSAGAYSRWWDRFGSSQRDTHPEREWCTKGERSYYQEEDGRRENKRKTVVVHGGIVERQGWVITFIISLLKLLIRVIYSSIVYCVAFNLHCYCFIRIIFIKCANNICVFDMKEEYILEFVCHGHDW